MEESVCCNDRKQNGGGLESTFEKLKGYKFMK
jgi:hypothetical protein